MSEVGVTMRIQRAEGIEKRNINTHLESITRPLSTLETVRTSSTTFNSPPETRLELPLLLDEIPSRLLALPHPGASNFAY